MALEEETTPEAPSERKSFGDQGSVVSQGTFQTRQTFVTARSDSEEFSQVSQDKSPNDYVDLSAEEDEEEDEATLWDSVRELASDRRAQGTAALTLGGYVTVGVVGGTSGLVTGGTVGTVLGLGPVLVTAGLSVPVGAVVGACTGLCVGASAGAATGAAAGFFLGRRAFYRSPAQLQSTVEAGAPSE
mmetsp:Transcript_55745/g.133401  ORF Transcript_55745/g.133401 Transcript_55745/m.133401 type:complete len:187 (+) Transcript_55745:47-607(+)